VNQQVKGFADNLKQMKTGEIRMFVLPQELGYGTVGLANAVSPYSTTIWLVQLVKVIHT
jgi:FKBP-type peptidyl-prolyl cis-trans isomerase